MWETISTHVKNANIDRYMSSNANIYYKISKKIYLKRRNICVECKICLYLHRKYVISRNISYKYDSKKFFNRRNF